MKLNLISLRVFFGVKQKNKQFTGQKSNEFITVFYLVVILEKLGKCNDETDRFLGQKNNQIEKNEGKPSNLPKLERQQCCCGCVGMQEQASVQTITPHRNANVSSMITSAFITCKKNHSQAFVVSTIRYQSSIHWANTKYRVKKQQNKIKQVWKVPGQRRANTFAKGVKFGIYKIHFLSNHHYYQ